MKRLIVVIILSLSLCVTLAAQTAAQKYVQQLRTTDELKESVWGIKAVKLSGEVLADYCSTTRMVPASNVKVFTTGLALSELGSDHRLKTTLAYTGSIVDGTLKGDLYIVGGGDPTIGARDSVATPLQTTFSRWEKIIKDAGIKRIDGRIVGDGRYLDCEPQNHSWQLEDAASGDGTMMTGLSFGGGLQAFTVSSGTSVGAPVKVNPVFPDTPWMSWRNTCRTSPAGTAQDLYYDCTDLAPVASMTGTLPMGVKEKRITCTNPFGAMTCAYYFYKYLEAKGFDVAQGPADVDPQGFIRDFEDDGGKAATDLKAIGVTLSPALKDIVRQTNAHSDNFYAEALLRAMAREKTGSACFDSCQTARQRAFERLGVSGSSRMQFYDGSGLSRKDYVSPDFFVRFLTAMHSSKEYAAFRSSLPQAGTGTLASRLASAPASTRSRVFMKSGSMNGVRCFCGYILPSGSSQDDTIVFSIMTNNTVVASSRINFIMDKLITLLAEEN